MRFISQTFEHDGALYRLELGVDQAALLQGQLNVPVTARRLAPNGEPVVEIKAVLTLDLDHERMVVSIEGVEVGHIPLGDIGTAEAEFPTEDGGTGFAWQDLLGFFVPAGAPLDEVIEEAIQALPVPADPVLGCLIKSGIASTAGQIVRCYNGTGEFDGRMARARAIARCLGANSGRIFWATTKRTFNCVLRLGF